MSTLVPSLAARPRGPFVLRVAAALAFVLLWQVLAGLAPDLTPALGADPAAAQATRPRTAVMIGDDFFSGEAGRWKGNAGWTAKNSHGTDIAMRYDANAWPSRWTFEPTLAYTPDSWSNGCRRSLSSPLVSMFEGHMSVGELQKGINIACSGAQSKHVWGYAAGGTAFKGEQPQTAQLYNIAATHDVKLILVGIGANDLGLQDALSTCKLAYMNAHGWVTQKPWIGDHCSDDLRESHEPRLSTVRANVMKSVDLVRATMAQRGYSSTDYRLVVVGYPGVLSPHNRYQWPEKDRRYSGCMFRDSDSEYVNETLVRKLNAHLHAATHLKGTEFLDITQVLNGHRLCESGTFRPSGWQVPSAATSEWVRWDENDPSDRYRPNVYGQQAIGRCMRLAWLSPVGQFGCLGSPNTTPAGVRLVDGRPLKVVSSTVQTITANLGKTPLTRDLGVTGNPYSPADMAIVDVEVDAPYHHLLSISVRRPDGKIQTVQAKSASTGAGRRTHRALVTAPANPNGTWQVRIANHGQFSSQNATLHRVTLTQY